MSESWQQIDGLAAGEAAEGKQPHLVRRARVDGAAVIQLTFTDGQELTDHRAPKPILLIGQRGTVTVTVAGETLELNPGSAIHIAAREPHAVAARAGEAEMTLVLLGG